MINVFELCAKVYLKKDIGVDESLEKITDFINLTFGSNDKMVDFHNKNAFKFYVHDSLYPVSKDSIYNKDNMYQFRIRTVDDKLCNYFLEHIENISTNEIKGIIANVKKVPKKPIKSLYTLTPCIIKTDEGYYKNNLSFDEFEKRLVLNLKKKYENYTQKIIGEEAFFSMIKYKNSKPIKVKYKNISLLGDKLEFEVNSDELSQELAYFSLGTGIGELNSLGCGFALYKWY